MAIFTIIASIIGAGFASGQEIYLFFYKYGLNGIYGLLVCSLLIAYIVYKVLYIVYSKNSKNYESFLRRIFNSGSKKRTYLDFSYISNIIVNIFLLFSFFIMIAGFASYFEQELKISHIFGAVVISICSFLVFMTNMNGFTKLNSIIVPILIGCIIVVGTKNMLNIELNKIDFAKSNSLTWIIKSIIYGSYNIILLIPVLVNLKSYIKNKKSIFFISISTGIIFFMLSIIIFFLLANVDVPFNNLEMPIIYVIKNVFSEFKIIYGGVILISIFTTATAIGISFLENVCKNKKSYPHVAGMMCITGIVFSNFGFSNMVKMLFPVFGYLGLIQIWGIINYNSK